MQIAKILERINLNSSKIYEPTLKTLQLLQKQYILNVPYENLDFVLKRKFSVDLVKIYEKIVDNNRGGICYESNTLFIYLLKSLGFTAHMTFAKVADLTYIGKDYPHLIILVNLDEIDYLVDVANGQNVREPMNIDNKNFISTVENNDYKIKITNNKYVLLVSHKQKAWLPRYHFTKQQKSISDFADIFESDKHHKSHPKTPLLVTLAKEDGRITMQNDTITLKEGENRHSWNVSKEDKIDILRDYFNIRIEI